MEFIVLTDSVQCTVFSVPFSPLILYCRLQFQTIHTHIWSCVRLDVLLPWMNELVSIFINFYCNFFKFFFFSSDYFFVLFSNNFCIRLIFWFSRNLNRKIFARPQFAKLFLISQIEKKNSWIKILFCIQYRWMHAAHSYELIDTL